MATAPDTVKSDDLTPADTKRLVALEKKIDKGIRAFVEVGEALQEIRDGRLHRESHDTFQAYCEDRWGIGRNYANKQIAAASVIAVLGTDVPTPRNEATARPLAALLDQPDEMTKAWFEARRIASAEGREPMADDVIDTAVWKAHRQAKLGNAPTKVSRETPEKSNRARLRETMAIIVEIPAKVGNIDLEAVRKIDTRTVCDERVQLIQDADAALLELMEALEPAEASV